MKLEHFKAEEARDAIVEEIKNYFSYTDKPKAVIGISGGKDSTVCAALLVRAIGKNNVYGVLLPDGKQSDISDSYKIVKKLGINYKEVNIGSIHYELMTNVLCSGCNGNFDVDRVEASEINVMPRIRMTVLRYISQALGARLCGTGNASEEFVGYCTKDGDTSCDFNPIGYLTSLEVVELGRTMSEIPIELVEKTPSDGLSGMPDEEKLGVSYEDIHFYIRNNGILKDRETAKKIGEMYKNSYHKRNGPFKILTGKYNNQMDTKYQKLFW